jgi:hypothetical protein
MAQFMASEKSNMKDNEIEAVLRMALESLERIDLWLKARYSGIGLVGVELEALTALRQAIDAAPQLEQAQPDIKQSVSVEPVAFRTESRITKAVGYWPDRVPDYIDADSWEITPLYTSPPYVATPRQRPMECKPLTDEQISDMWCEVSNTDFVTADTHEFARAIEAAHGIMSLQDGKGEA